MDVSTRRDSSFLSSAEQERIGRLGYVSKATDVCDNVGACLPMRGDVCLYLDMAFKTLCREPNKDCLSR